MSGIARPIASPRGRTQSPVEAGRIVRAASRGFSILLVGGVAQPLVAHWVQPLGVVWLVVVALIAFAVAGYRAPSVKRRAWVSGIAAALGSYCLVIPLVISAAGGLPVEQVLITAATAVAVGAASASLRMMRSDR